MSQEINLSHFLSALQVPEATQAKLTFCPGKKAAKVKAWVNELRATKTSETGAILYACLPELARLKVDADVRREMLEAVRPSTQHVIEGLTRDFLNRPISLSKQAQKSIIIAQAIQKNMIDGYSRCVVDLAQAKRMRPQTIESLTHAIHRAISGIGMVFFRCYQLYTQPPVGFWLRLHALFQIADYFDLLARPVRDEQLSSVPATNIQSAYLRVLLMATAKLNQVSQKDVSLVFEALETWAQSARLHTLEYNDKEIIYVVNISRDCAPIYKSRFSDDTPGRVLQIGLGALVSLLAKHTPNQKNGSIDPDIGNTINIPTGFPDSLLEHLLQCWSNIAQRQQERRDVATEAEVCIGLVNVHYFVCGEQAFEEFTGQGEPYGQDILSTITAGFGANGTPNNNTPAIPSYHVTIQNVSAGGCCILWKENAPPKLQAGELLGIKESGRHIWSIGVIRWIRQFKGSTQLGIQTLTNNPRPWGAGQMYDMGGYSDYMRAFSVPASRNAPASIVTAQAPFREQDKVKIFDGDNTFTAKLTNALFSTGAIRQFAYHPLDTAGSGEILRERRPSSFDDDWE